MFTGSSNDTEASASAENVEQSTDFIPKVQVINSESRTVQQTLNINGITQAKRWVAIRSESTGKIVSILKSQGNTVKAGDIIAKVDVGDLPSKLIQARAAKEKARLEFEGAQKLKNQGLQNEAQLAGALANYEQAKAQLAGLELQLANTDIRAPFDGQLELVHVELGSFVRPGDSVADLYDFSKLVFTGAVSEKDILSLKIGQKATVDLINGDTANATVEFIGATTNPNTRTFTVELSIPTVTRNVSGVTSTARIAIDQAEGHYISPALLFISNEGDLGLKTIDRNDQVQFNKVEIIRSATDGVWVTGLAKQAAIIVVGQGFVNVGDIATPTVKPFDPSKAVGL
jgi:multidrug efflux system membrane fusion protein